MKVEEIAEAVAKLPPDQLARFRRWFTAFEAGRANHAEELDSAATKLGRRSRTNGPQQSAALFDHLVGPGEQRRGQFECESTFCVG
jgi:hypothetical protein